MILFNRQKARMLEAEISKLEGQRTELTRKIGRLEREKRYLENMVSGLRQAKQKEDEHFFACVSPASRREYEKWLKGYLKNGGKITHEYNYPFERWDWYVVNRDCTVPKRHGAESYNLIIGAGVKISNPNDTGHNDLFFMDNFIPSSTVPKFSNLDI